MWASLMSINYPTVTQLATTPSAFASINHQSPKQFENLCSAVYVEHKTISLNKKRKHVQFEGIKKPQSKSNRL
jgi:hypothetical protein